jgi:hypothetical protein
MTEQEAKAIISSYGASANIAEHIEAIRVALEVLGEDATMTEIWRWAKQPEKEGSEC